MIVLVLYRPDLVATVPRASVLSLALWSRTNAKAVRLSVLPSAAECATVVEIEPAASRHARRVRGGCSGGLHGNR